MKNERTWYAVTDTPAERLEIFALLLTEAEEGPAQVTYWHLSYTEKPCLNDIVMCGN